MENIEKKNSISHPNYFTVNRINVADPTRYPDIAANIDGLRRPLGSLAFSEENYNSPNKEKGQYLTTLLRMRDEELRVIQDNQPQDLIRLLKFLANHESKFVRNEAGLFAVTSLNRGALDPRYLPVDLEAYVEIAEKVLGDPECRELETPVNFKKAIDFLANDDPQGPYYQGGPSAFYGYAKLSTTYNRLHPDNPLPPPSHSHEE